MAKRTTAKTNDATDSTMPPVGSKAPAFDLPASSGAMISLKDFAGKKTVVLYFYPKADTPGCTTEACGFSVRSLSITRNSSGLLKPM